MRHALLILLLISMPGLTGCQGLWHTFLNAVVDVAPDRFALGPGDNGPAIPLRSSHDPRAREDGVDTLIVVVHGGGLNADNAFANGQAMAASLGLDGRAMVLAPQFLEGVDVDEPDLLKWDGGWREGDLSLARDGGPPPVSSFAVLDALLETTARSKPNLGRVVILGHSAGGQFVQRYAAVNTVHEALAHQGVAGRGVAVVYAVANPSSYLYLDSARPGATPDDLAACPAYDDYKYGLHALRGHAQGMDPAAIRDQLLSRPVLFAYGALDTERNWSLDDSCPAEAQGHDRRERALRYREHLESLAGPSPSPHVWLEVPDTGHDAKAMYAHPVFIEALKSM